MRFKAILLLFLSATAFAIPSPKLQVLHRKRQQNQGSIDWASLSAALASFTKNTPGALPSPLIPTKTANLGNLSPPPRSLIPVIITAVPASVLVELVNPAARSSLASEFKAGSTPSWYQSLPTDVKSYLSVVKSQISEGALTATTGLAYQTSTSAAAASTAKSGSAPSTATSSGLGAAARPTGALAASVAGAFGVLGLALAL